MNPATEPHPETAEPPQDVIVSPAELFPRLLRVRFLLEVQRDCRLPPYAGSMLRGLLGHGLRGAVCVTGARRCDGCLLQHHCFYSRFFESPVADGELAQRFSATPHPWVLEPPQRLPRQLPGGGRIDFSLLILGESASHLAYLVHALQRTGARGLGRDNTPFRLADVAWERTLGTGQWQSCYDPDSGTLETVGLTAWPALQPPPGRWRLRLITPLRMKRHGRLMGPRDFDPAFWLHSAGQRIRLLHRLYGARDTAIPVLPDPQAIADGAIVEQRLRWHDWTRYSSRQRTRMQMGGLVGELLLDGQRLAPWWPWLWAAQWLHLGKQTAMGLGQFRIETENHDGKD